VTSDGFVDIHSHVVPSGDDGVASVDEGLELCRDAAEHGTRVLFATPHVWPQLLLTDQREEEIRARFAELAARAPLELELGFELTPMPSLLDEDPNRYELGATGAVLIEVPFHGGTALLFEVAEHVEASGRRPVIAHPERTEAVLENEALAAELAERGWLLQVNSTSLLGRHGAEIEELAWRLLDDGLVAIVASDAHRPARPAQLDEAYGRVRARLGERARRLFDGSALTARRTPSRVAERGA
jgi:protein-tyrosine phosphatase